MSSYALCTVVLSPEGQVSAAICATCRTVLGRLVRFICTDEKA